MRPVVLMVCASALLAGCSGVDAQRAQDLLAQASSAQSQVRSFTIAARVWATQDAQQINLNLTGGGYAKGPRRGDFYIRGTLSGLPVDGGAFTIVRRGGSGFAEFGGRRIALPAPSAAASPALGSIDLTRYVKSVRVDENHTLAGQPVARVSGTLDTGAFVRDLLARLGPLPGPVSSDAVAKSFGDTHAVLYISKRSHLVSRAIVDVTLKSGGEELELHVDYALTHVNRPVAFPG